MLTLLRSGRWLAFTATALIAIVLFGLLSIWQWHRAEEKRAEHAVVSSSLTAPAVPLGEATSDWRAVTVTGQYDPQRQYLARNRPLDGSNGFWVVSLLSGPVGDAWVVRGWTPVQLAAGAAQEPPAPPEGTVTVEGYARMSQPGPARAADLPPAQISNITVADLDQSAGVTSATPMFVVAANDPLLRPVPVPEPTDTRNLSYAGQWLLFAGITIGGWFFFLRREAAEDRSAKAVAADRPLATKH